MQFVSYFYVSSFMLSHKGFVYSEWLCTYSTQRGITLCVSPKSGRGRQLELVVYEKF